MAANAKFTGHTAKPVVMIANHNDPTIPPSVTDRYVQLAAAAGREANVLLLPPQGQGHCEFPEGPVEHAMDLLEAWVDSGQRPTP